MQLQKLLPGDQVRIKVEEHVVLILIPLSEIIDVDAMFEPIKEEVSK